jgi:hypothetical protein
MSTTLQLMIRHGVVSAARSRRRADGRRSALRARLGKRTVDNSTAVQAAHPPAVIVDSESYYYL